MKPTERRMQVVNFVRDVGRASVEELSDRLNVSRETIRRDLTELSNRGLIQKYHGGAHAIEATRESPFGSRMSENLSRKRAVARRAADLFKSGSILFIDTGSTTVLFAEELANISGITVITNSLTIASLVGRNSADSHVYVIGGEYRDEAAENLGPLAIAQISNFFAQHAVLTVTALNELGAMDFNLQEAEVARAMIEKASEVTIILDSSKFDRTALFNVCPLSMIDRIICDEPPPPRLAAALSKANVEVILAGS